MNKFLGAAAGAALLVGLIQPALACPRHQCDGQAEATERGQNDGRGRRGRFGVGPHGERLGKFQSGLRGVDRSSGCGPVPACD